MSGGKSPGKTPIASFPRLSHGLSHGFSTDTLRASLRFFPRARTEAGEWRRKPHVKVPSPRTAARRMSPRPFHGARQIGGRDAARTPYGCPHGRRTREARAARRMSLRTFYGARQIGGKESTWSASRPLPRGLCPCRANAVLCVTRCAADWCGLAWRVAAHNNGGEAPFKENYALLKKLTEM